MDERRRDVGERVGDAARRHPVEDGGRGGAGAGTDLQHPQRAACVACRSELGDEVGDDRVDHPRRGGVAVDAGRAVLGAAGEQQRERVHRAGEHVVERGRAALDQRDLLGAGRVGGTQLRRVGHRVVRPVAGGELGEPTEQAAVPVGDPGRGIVAEVAQRAPDGGDGERVEAGHQRRVVGQRRGGTVERRSTPGDERGRVGRHAAGARGGSAAGWRRGHPPQLVLPVVPGAARRAAQRVPAGVAQVQTERLTDERAVLVVEADVAGERRAGILEAGAERDVAPHPRTRAGVQAQLVETDEQVRLSLLHRQHRRAEDVEAGVEQRGVDAVRRGLVEQLGGQRDAPERLAVAAPDVGDAAHLRAELEAELAEPRVVVGAVDVLGAPRPHLVGVEHGGRRRGAGGERGGRMQRPRRPGRGAADDLDVAAAIGRGVADHELHDALVVVGEQQRLADLEPAHLVRRAGVEVGGRGEGHLQVCRGGQQRAAVDAVVVEERRPGGAEDRLVDGGVERRGLHSDTEQRVRASGGGAPPRRLHPVPLALERVGRQVDDAAAAGGDRRPVQRRAGDVQRPRRGEELVPLVVAGAHRRQPRAGALVDDVAGHVQQRRVGAGLDERAHAAGVDRGERVGEAHRAAQVAPPVAGGDEVVAGGQRAGHPGDDVEARRGEGDGGGDGLQLVEDRVDLRRVGGDRHRQRADLDPVPAQLVEHGGEPAAGAGEGDALRAVDGRDRHVLAGAGTSDGVLRLGLGGERGGHLPVRWQRGHQPAPCRDEAQPVLQAHHPGHDGGHVLADAVPGDDRRAHAPRRPQLGERPLHREHGRLGVRHRPEQLLAARLVEQHRGERLVHQRGEQRCAAIDRVAEHGRGGVQLGTHPRVLRAVPGEQERHLRGAPGHAGHHRRARRIDDGLDALAARRRAERGRGVGRGRGDDGEALGELGPPAVQGAGDVGEGQLRARRQLGGDRPGELAQRTLGRAPSLSSSWRGGAAAGGGGAAASTTTWAFVPENPNELTPAIAPRRRRHGVRVVGSVERQLVPGRCAGWARRSAAAAGSRRAAARARP